MDRLKSSFAHIDFVLLAAALGIVSFGLVTMNSFTGTSPFFDKQVIWVSISLGVFSIAAIMDWRFLRRTEVVVALYIGVCGLLLSLFAVGSVFKGAQSWFNLGFIAFQPVDLAKIALVILLSKYFSRRHVEIADIRHIVVSGIYAFVLFLLIAVQPDFGSAVIIFLVWFGMVFVSGISRKHLIAVVLMGLLTFLGLWNFGFHEYQKARVRNFVHPLSDIHGTGYNAYQSTIAVGSGGLLGKGIGYGTQSKLRFLPEYQTDFIFASFAEEWGFVGICLLIILFSLVFFRLFSAASVGATNFESLFALGISILFMSHFFIHAGINMGVLPVTGTTMPLMSYGGSHLIAEFLGLGMVVGMRRHARSTRRSASGREVSHGYDR